MMGIENGFRDHVTKNDMRDAIAAAVTPLATKEELRTAIAPLATKEELRLAIAPLATRAEMQEGFTRVDQRFGSIEQGLSEVREALAEQSSELKLVRSAMNAAMEEIRYRIRVVAEGHTALGAKLEGHKIETDRRFVGVEARLDEHDVQLHHARQRGLLP